MVSRTLGVVAGKQAAWKEQFQSAADSNAAVFLGFRGLREGLTELWRVFWGAKRGS